MKTKILSLLTLIFVCEIMSGSVITPEEALLRAKEFQFPIATRASINTPQLIKAYEDEPGSPTLYVFNLDENLGFMVLSAESQITPVLGYSDQGSFNPNNIPPALSEWLQTYSEQINFIRSMSLAPFNSRSEVELPAWEPITPLVKDNWNQIEPYNELCPMDGNNHSATGCVATAMAMVMDYFKYPAKGKGTVSYEWQLNNSTPPVTLSMDFSNISFDWDNMIPNYTQGNYTKAQADAVATLMVAAGYSVQMNYSYDSSGAFVGLVPSALVNNFSYDKNIRYLYREWYQYSEWAKMIYDNLHDIGPIIYSGVSTVAGHAFVLDGYQSNGYFHINWGWSGMSNGYFLLDALNPSALGIGSGAESGYNFTQGAVFGIQPPIDNSPENNQDLSLGGSLAGATDSRYLSLYVKDSQEQAIFYNGINPLIADIGIKYENTEDNSEPPQYVESDWIDMSFETGYGFLMNNTQHPRVLLEDIKLKRNKKYKITIVFKTNGSEWIDVLSTVGFANYFYITKTGVGQNIIYDIENIPPMNLTFEEITINSGLYPQYPVEYSVSVTNNNDSELTRYFSFCLLTENNRIAFYGSPYVFTAAPFVTSTFTTSTALVNNYSASFNKPTEFYPGIFDYETGEIFYKSPNTVTMGVAPTEELKFSGWIEVENGEKEIKDKSTIYHVNDNNEIKVTSHISVEQGYFYCPIELIIYRSMEGSDYWVSEQIYSLGTKMIEDGESESLTTTVTTSDFNFGELYGLNTMVYVNNKSVGIYDKLSQYFIIDKSGSVEKISNNFEGIKFFHNRLADLLIVNGGNDQIRSIEIYDLGGNKLNSQVSYINGCAEIDISNFKRSIIIVHAIDSNGNHKSLKLAL